MKTIIMILISLFVLGSSQVYAAIQAEEVMYDAEGVTLKGYLAYDDSLKKKRPGVLVVHEWWGHNDYARKRARMLAELGYTALAVDMYGDGKQAAHPEEAGKFSSEVMKNMASAKARFMAALESLKRHKTTDSSKVAAIGYCFGGGVVLHMARLGIDLDGVVSFHGSYATNIPAKKGKVKAAILVCHGAEDKFVTPEQITAFKKEMKEAEVNFRFLSYKNALHSFTNPEADSFARRFKLPLAYNAEADQQSWTDMQSFFKVIFKE
ncbi:MAG: dienelactone hydrolase family protein [Proteobacteria bacterium]|nr:dienelactone hydrolase family protein [Pseudomonadota bacterium]